MKDDDLRNARGKDLHVRGSIPSNVSFYRNKNSLDSADVNHADEKHADVNHTDETRNDETSNADNNDNNHADHGGENITNNEDSYAKPSSIEIKTPDAQKYTKEVSHVNNEQSARIYVNKHRNDASANDASNDASNNVSANDASNNASTDAYNSDVSDNASNDVSNDASNNVSANDASVNDAYKSDYASTDAYNSDVYESDNASTDASNDAYASVNDIYKSDHASDNADVSDISAGENHACVIPENHTVSIGSHDNAITGFHDKISANNKPDGKEFAKILVGNKRVPADNHASSDVSTSNKISVDSKVSTKISADNKGSTKISADKISADNKGSAKNDERAIEIQRVAAFQKKILIEQQENRVREKASEAYIITHERLVAVSPDATTARATTARAGTLDRNKAVNIAAHNGTSNLNKADRNEGTGSAVVTVFTQKQINQILLQQKRARNVDREAVYREYCRQDYEYRQRPAEEFSSAENSYFSSENFHTTNSVKQIISDKYKSLSAHRAINVISITSKNISGGVYAVVKKGIIGSTGQARTFNNVDEASRIVKSGYKLIIGNRYREIRDFANRRERREFIASWNSQLATWAFDGKGKRAIIKPAETVADVRRQALRELQTLGVANIEGRNIVLTANRLKTRLKMRERMNGATQQGTRAQYLLDVVIKSDKIQEMTKRMKIRRNLKSATQFFRQSSYMMTRALQSTEAGQGLSITQQILTQSGRSVMSAIRTARNIAQAPVFVVKKTAKLRLQEKLDKSKKRINETQTKMNNFKKTDSRYQKLKAQKERQTRRYENLEHGRGWRRERRIESRKNKKKQSQLGRREKIAQTRFAQSRFMQSRLVKNTSSRAKNVSEFIKKITRKIGTVFSGVKMWAYIGIAAVVLIILALAIYQDSQLSNYASAIVDLNSAEGTVYGTDEVDSNEE